MGDLVWVRNFFAKTSGEGIFSGHITVKDFFPVLYSKRYFFSVQDTFLQSIFF